MPIKIALILSVVLQFMAAIIAMTLIKRTRNNIAWWLISGGFLLMAIRRVLELLQVYDSDSELITGLLSSWTGVLISIIMLLSLLFIKRIFNIQKQIDELRKQNELRVLSAIIKTEETERQHFAKELHDGLGPILSAIKMSVSSLNTKSENDPVVMMNTEKLIDESIITLKNISNNLSPHVLINFGLCKALKSFIQKCQIIGEPDIDFNCNLENERLSYNIEVVMYRVICELLSNTIKHAHAKNVFIDLLKEDDFIKMKYIDDGIGFEDNPLENNLNGLGYSNIQSRIKSLDGQLSVFSKAGEGVRIETEIKLKNNEKIDNNTGR